MYPMLVTSVMSNDYWDTLLLRLLTTRLLYSDDLGEFIAGTDWVDAVGSMLCIRLTWL